MARTGPGSGRRKRTTKAEEEQRQQATPQAARGLLRAATFGALGTLDREDGSPVASFCAVATLADGTPVLLQSDLAQHTRNLQADDRASLMVATPDPEDDPMAEPRVTFIGRVERPDDDAEARRRYLARHPSAAQYADFGDFHFYTLSIDRAHLIAGFGRVKTFDGAVLRPQVGDLREKEAAFVDSATRAHAGDIDLIARYLGRRRSRKWRLVGVDVDGIDLRRNDAYLRIPFNRPVHDAESARTAFAMLVQLAHRHAR